MGKVAEDGDRSLDGTIIFATVGRPRYSFDVFGIAVPKELGEGGALLEKLEERLTDGKSVNSNGHLVEGNAKEDVLNWLKENWAADYARVFNGVQGAADEIELLTYISEKEGRLGIHFSFLLKKKHGDNVEDLLNEWGGVSGESKKTGASRNIALVRSLFGATYPAEPHLEDRPQIGGGRIVFVSTQKALEIPRQSWTAVYSMSLVYPDVIRLTPEGVNDYSPSISPSGEWVIAASLQGRGWQGEIEDLKADLYVFKAADGSQRRLVTKHGGWPSWGDHSTVFFHRQAEDGWWSVFRIRLPEDFLTNGGQVVECRVTPPGVHAFTPSASQTGNWIAVGTRRPGSEFRHVEIFDLRSKTFIKLTEKISPSVNYYNPFVSPSSNKIVYHRCRGYDPRHAEESLIPRLEPLQSPVPTLALLRVAGDFPAFSPDGSLIAYVPELLTDSGVVVTKCNGGWKRQIFSGMVFGISWDRKRKGVVYTSHGVPFSPGSSEVHVISIFNADREEPSDAAPEYKQLTKNGTRNNAFPAGSPDGKHVVFRSGRNGHKNLYIMDAVDGEEKELRQLTDGPWTDTMPAWSPTGEWIAFSSNRDNPDVASFAGYLIHPDGTGLHKILSHGGLVNHLEFSPDGKSLVFTADFAGVSAEPISVPNQFQPYGEIFICRLDGSAIQRLTHNAYEEGTPNWGPTFFKDSDLSGERNPVDCKFEDVHWLAREGEAAKLDVPPPPTWCPRVQKGD